MHAMTSNSVFPGSSIKRVQIGLVVEGEKTPYLRIGTRTPENKGGIGKEIGKEIGRIEYSIQRHSVKMKMIMKKKGISGIARPGELRRT